MLRIEAAGNGDKAVLHLEGEHHLGVGAAMSGSYTAHDIVAQHLVGTVLPTSAKGVPAHDFSAVGLHPLTQLRIWRKGWHST